MKVACPVCRALPKGLRDWLLDVFAVGDASDSLYPIAQRYVTWGAARLVRGESVAFPLLRHRPGDLDPFEVWRARFALSLELLSGQPYRVNPDGSRVRTGTLELSSDVASVRALAVQFQSDERKVRHALDTARAMLKEYGPEFSCCAGSQLAVATIRPGDALAGRAAVKR